MKKTQNNSSNGGSYGALDCALDDGLGVALEIVT